MKNKAGALVSFHPRKQHNFEQAAVLAELFPRRFKHVTSVYFAPLLVKWLSKLSPKYAGKIGKRSYNQLPKKYVRTMPSTEIRRWRLERKQGQAHLWDYMALNEFWQKEVLRNYQAPKICISYDGISHLLFREWKGKSVLI